MSNHFHELQRLCKTSKLWFCIETTAKFFTVLVVITACAHLPVSVAQGTTPPPNQSSNEAWYVLMGVDSNPPAAALDPKIAGISVRVSWSQIEPEDDQWDWSYLDQVFDWAEYQDKLVMLRVMAGTLAPAHSYDKQVANIPTPWEPRHQAEYAELMQVLAARYGLRSELRLVHVSGFWNSAEFHVPRKIEDDPRMADAFIERLKATAYAFPAQRISLNHSPESFSQAVISAAQQLFPNQITFQMNALKADINTSWPGYTTIRDLGLEGWDIGWQFVGPSINDKRFGGPFQQAVDIGRLGNPKYWEIYAPDVPLISNP